MSGEEINVFKLETPKSFVDLLAQIELISKDMKKWTDKLININGTARKELEIISEDEVKDSFHNISQNIIDLSKFIQKKVRGD